MKNVPSWPKIMQNNSILGVEKKFFGTKWPKTEFSCYAEFFPNYPIVPYIWKNAEFFAV
jgi:hypothetical protein